MDSGDKNTSMDDYIFHTELVQSMGYAYRWFIIPKTNICPYVRWTRLFLTENSRRFTNYSNKLQNYSVTHTSIYKKAATSKKKATEISLFLQVEHFYYSNHIRITISIVQLNRSRTARPQPRHGSTFHASRIAKQLLTLFCERHNMSNTSSMEVQE